MTYPANDIRIHNRGKFRSEHIAGVVIVCIVGTFILMFRWYHVGVFPRRKNDEPVVAPLAIYPDTSGQEPPSYNATVHNPLHYPPAAHTSTQGPNDVYQASLPPHISQSPSDNYCGRTIPAPTHTNPSASNSWSPNPYDQYQTPIIVPGDVTVTSISTVYVQPTPPPRETWNGPAVPVSTYGYQGQQNVYHPR